MVGCVNAEKCTCGPFMPILFAFSPVPLFGELALSL